MGKVFDAYAAYYDLLYQDKNYKQESEYIIKLLADNNIYGGRILELGSGTGKHAEEFAKVGFIVHGVDLSPVMIQRANQQKKNDLASKLHFEVGNVRNYSTNNKFDIALSLFHVTSYQKTNEDLLSMFTTASKHLNIGGVFIFDFWYGPAVLSEKPEVRVKRMQDNMVSIVRIAEPSMYCNHNIVEVNYTVMVTENNEQKIEVLTEKHTMRYLFLPELENILKISGMQLLTSYSWLSNQPLSIDSWQGVIVAQKI